MKLRYPFTRNLILWVSAIIMVLCPVSMLLEAAFTGFEQPYPIYIINESADVCASLFLNLIFWCCILDVRNTERDSKSLIYFIYCILVVMMGLWSDYFAWRVQGLPQYSRFNFFVNLLFYLAVPLSIYTYWLYVREIAPMHRIARLLKLLSIIQNASCIAAVCLILLNIPLRHYFTVDTSGMYSRTHGGFWLSIVPNVLIMLVTIVAIVLSDIPAKEKTIYIFYYAVLLVPSALQTVMLGVSISYLLVTLSLCLTYIRILLQRDRMRMEMSMKIRHAQVQPHFISNGMASLRRLIRTDPDGANEMLGYLIGYLRESMAFYEAEQMIPIEKELEFVENYLSVENVRFSGEIDFSVDYDGTSFLIPPITVQPIVENALRHGIRKNQEGGYVRVEVHTQGRNHVIRVIDDGCGFDPNALPNDGKEHFGIANTRERIRYMTGGNLIVDSEIGQGTVVEIKI